MSKYTKKNRSKRSALKLEALEQRQLLATIVAGSGTEVDSNVTLSNGNTYDQILLTGSTITVKADAGQVTRVDFLDADGDIIRAEFAGAGELKIDLANFKDAATPENYASTVKYVQGDASFRIEGSDATTNVTIYSLGKGNVNGGLANPIFADGTKLGGNHTANVTRLVIEADESALGSMFGGIRAANAVFSGSSGAVGIVAPDVQFQGPIIIGDIDTTGNALAVIQLGQFSTNKTVQVAGGDLKLTAGAFVDPATSNVAKLISSSGQNSNGELLSTTALANNTLTAHVGASNISYQSSAAKVVVDGDTVTAEQLAAYAKMYLNEVELVNWKAGDVFKAHLIGNVTVTGDLGGAISTNVDDDGVSDTDEFGIGNVTITGKLLGTGNITSATSVGNVSVTGGIDLSTGAAGAGPLVSTMGRADQSAKIGDISFGSNVKLADDNVTIASSATLGAGTGGIGNVSIAGDLTATDADNDTFVAANGNIGNITATKTLNVAGTGKFAFAANGSIGNISGTVVTLTALQAAGTDKNIGNISATDGALTLATVTASKSIGNISATKAVTLEGDIEATAGNIGTITAGAGLDVQEDLKATAGSIGAITVSGGDFKLGSADTDVVTAKSIGNITVNGDENDLIVASAVTANTTSIGNIAVNGENANIDLSTGGNFVAKTSIGNITVAGGAIFGATVASEAEFLANKIGNISLTAVEEQDATVMLQNVSFIATATDTSTDDAAEASAKAASIGNITIDASAEEGVAIANGAASTDATLGTGFSSSGNIGNVTITASESGKLLASPSASLVVRAGNSNMGADNDPLNTFAEGVNTAGGVTIGDVSITANFTGLSNGTDGTGLLIASGVAITNTNGGNIVVGSDTNAAVTVNATKLGTGGTIGAVTINNSDADTGTDVRGFANSTVLSGSTAGFDSGAVIIADGIASIDVATAVEVKHYTPTGQPLKGAIAVGAVGAEGGVDDLFIVVL